jgi:hypothetical protein
MDKGEIILYQPDNSIQLEVRMEEDTVWLNRQQMAVLFDRDVKTIGKHINNALSEELHGMSTVANFATVQKEGSRLVSREIEYYNLDVILSVGYRVKSSSGILFRQWANNVLRKHLLHGYMVNQRILQLEQKVAEHDKQIEFFVRTSLPPLEGIFYDGQIFDAYTFAINLIKSAKTRIILIDNYIDESVLLMLSKRQDGVRALIVTRKITNTLKLDLARHQQQYSPIDVQEKQSYHDRFLIIDDTVYHLGASLKDLGKKLFAFSKMEMPVEKLRIEV